MSIPAQLKARGMRSKRNRVVAAGLISAVVVLGSCTSNPQVAKAKYMAEGKNYMSKEQFGDAAIEFRNALRLDPRFVDAYYQLAQADIAQHDWKAAYASLEKTLALDPNRMDARLDQGQLYLAARQLSRAEDDANYILKRRPDDFGAYQLLGAVQIGEQKLDAALASFARAAQLRPKDPSSCVNLALVEVSLRRFADAEQHLKNALAIDPKSAQAYVDLANLYRLQGQIPESKNVLTQAVAQDSQAPSLYIELASLLSNQGKENDAANVLHKLRKQLPNSAGAATAIGDYYFQRRQTGQALAEYRRGVSIDPKNLEIKKRILDVYLTTGQVQQAENLDKELVKSAPHDVFVRIDHGRLLMARGKGQDAASYLQRVAGDAAGSPQAYYYLAMAYWQNRDLGQAHGALLDALRASQDFPPALKALTLLGLEDGNAADAEIYGQAIVRQFPAAPDTRQLLADALAREGKLKAAEQQTLVAKQLAPLDPAVDLTLAQVYVAEKRPADAQKQFEAALQINPHSAVAMAQFADFLTRHNEQSQAFARVQQYVSANPGDANGYLILGSLDLQSKNYTASQTELHLAIQLDPKNIQAYVRLGRALEAEHQIDAAVSSYQKALDLQPNFPALATYVGNIYLDKGDLESARKYYRQALSYDSNFAVAIANTAWVDAEEGKDLEVALGMAEKAKSMDPDTPSITDTLGWVQYKRADYAAAVPLLEDCVSESPDSAEFRFHLGMALWGGGQKVKARENLETALRMRLRPDEAQKAQQALAQLR